jgi:hypothetical protein
MMWYPNKPDWKNAPDWANWLAMDANGEWHWFEFEPILDPEDGFFWGTILDHEKWEKVYTKNDWKNSLQERPKIS